MTGKQLTEIIETQLPVKVYGCIPKLEEFRLASRHLGLVTPYELSGIREDLEALGRAIQEYVDMEALLELASKASDIEDEVPGEWQEDLSSHAGQGLTIGVAFDRAFCFYYKDNLEVAWRNLAVNLYGSVHWRTRHFQNKWMRCYWVADTQKFMQSSYRKIPVCVRT